jgi:hypothetical protein
MMFPALHHWQATRDSLHRVALLMNAIRVHQQPALPHDLEHALHVDGDQLRTQGAPNGEIVLHLRALTLTHGTQVLPVATTSPSDLAQQLAQPLWTQYTPDTRAPQLDPTWAADYADVLRLSYDIMARARGRIFGMLTPMVLWPHHFDVAFTWYASGKVDPQAPQMTFGFATGEGAERPYFYATTYPLPPKLSEAPLSAPARWYSETWQGARLDYDAVREHANAESVIESFYQQAFEQGALHLKL